MSPGHNSGPVSADRLKSFIERIERLCEERDGIQSDIRDVFAAAKGVGYDVKTMRKVVAERKQDAADLAEQEALLDTYRHALGMNRAVAAVLGGATIRAAAKAHDVKPSTLHRAVPKPVENENGTADDADGEIAPDEQAAEQAAWAAVVSKMNGGALDKISNADPRAHESDVPVCAEPLAEGSAPAAGPEGGDRAGTHSHHVRDGTEVIEQEMRPTSASEAITSKANETAGAGLPDACNEIAPVAPTRGTARDSSSAAKPAEFAQDLLQSKAARAIRDLPEPADEMPDMPEFLRRVPA